MDPSEELEALLFQKYLKACVLPVGWGSAPGSREACEALGIEIQGDVFPGFPHLWQVRLPGGWAMDRDPDMPHDARRLVVRDHTGRVRLRAFMATFYDPSGAECVLEQDA